MNSVRLFRSFSYLIVLAFLAGACSTTPHDVTFEPKPKWSASKPLDDLKELPQDALAYMDKAKADAPLLTPETAKMRSEIYIDRLFAPWRGGNPAYARKSANRSLAAYSRNPGYDASGMAHLKPWADRIAWNANLRAFGSQRRPAIAVNNTNLRAIPTMDPRFGTPGRPGQGYPFDLLQVSALWIGTPVLVDHISRDGAWALVETAIAPGWVRTADLAYVDDPFMSQYLSKAFGTVIAENVPLLPGVQAGVGAVLAVEDTDGVRLRLAVPAPGPGGRAETRPVWVTQGQAGLMPMPATASNIARAANQMMGQPYGWGGLDGKRDCSAATRDVLAPFGLWLPRNSAAQAKSGMYIPLEGMTGEEKEQAILKNGVPYSTLVWMPGHILLYIGQYKGHPVVFHDVWGMRTLEPNGTEGRKVIGKAVVTTLRVGEIYPEVGPERIMLNRVRGITLVAPAGGKDGLEPEGEASEEGQLQ
ncbi:SH3 domain-containing protein [Fundidesulfovibrio terrae]|uniref:C40 family peptidase n=1 Tax=Fundidesulfovibrio terrae TaxID=2922866 RepID=UPI001FB0020F|nr:SH3 domain-containing C40 family peptidase [Fundidesulfovibrio terrae]